MNDNFYDFDSCSIIQVKFYLHAYAKFSIAWINLWFMRGLIHDCAQEQWNLSYIFSSSNIVALTLALHSTLLNEFRTK